MIKKGTLILSDHFYEIVHTRRNPACGCTRTQKPPKNQGWARNTSCNTNVYSCIMRRNTKPEKQRTAAVIA